MKPYSSYQDFDFEIPVGNDGDTYDRFIVRQREIKESLKIIELR
jgi:NADH-quinone oxidoreductase subunit D